MKTFSYMRRAVVYLCLAVILIAAVTHAGTHLPAVLLAALWIFVALVVSVPAPRRAECRAIQPFPVLRLCSARPPPVG
jgi:hypothetical protein